MWLLHGRKKTKKVKGGQTLHQRCPDCGADATFHEVEITTSAGAFFVDVVSDTERAFACSECDEVFDLRDTELPSGDVPVEIDLGIGSARVLVAEDVCVATDAEIGVGGIRVLGRHNDGVDVDYEEAPDAGSEVTRLVLEQKLRTCL